MKQSSYKIAVIMSVYINDGFSEFKEAFDSIIGQTYSNFDFFIYADGVVNKDISDFLLRCEMDNVIFIQADKNKGLAFALNHMISIVLNSGKFDFIARMDADDISRSDRFEQQIDFFRCNPEVDVVGGLCREFGSRAARDKCNVYLTDELIKHNVFKKCPFIHPSVMFKVSVFSNGVRYPENNPLTEDMCLWFELIHLNKKFANINSILIDYRIDENTLHRRRGIAKAMTEFTSRMYYARKLKLITIRNIMFIAIHFTARILPLGLFKLVHKLN